jgi:excisionase family DNA binding protein
MTGGYPSKRTSAYLGISDETVYGWIQFHDMPTHMMGDWNFKINELDEYVKAGGATL